MFTIKLSNTDFKHLLQHLTSAYEHYAEYSMDADLADVQSLIGAIIINSEEK